MIGWGMCEARTRKGKRCKLSALMKIPFSTLESVEAAVATGWPMLLPGMKQPETAGERRLCHVHSALYYDDDKSKLQWSRGKAIAPAKVSTFAITEQQKRLREWQETQK